MGVTTEPIRILHVDDEPAIAELTAEFLERADDRFSVEIETSPRAGLDTLSSTIDCVISDYDMPGQNGIEFCERVREEYPDLPFILYTGKGSEAVASDAITTGATDYLQKGTSTEQYELLANRIKNAITRYRTDMANQDRRDRQARQRDALADLIRTEAIATGNLQAAARRITETVARVVGVSRVTVWLFDDDPNRLRCVDRYDDGSATHSSGLELARSEVPSYLDALESNRLIAAPAAREDPRMEGLAGAYLEPHDITSVLNATLRSGDDLVGVLSVEATENRREWTDDERQFASDIANLLYRTLRNRERARRRAELSFRQSILDAQQEAIDDGLLVVDGAGDVVSYNDRLLALWGLTDDDAVDSRSLLRRATAALERPEPARKRLCDLVTDRTATVEDELELADGRTFEWYTTPIFGDDDTHYGRLYRFRDVTAARDERQALEVQTRAMDEAPLGIGITDPSQPDNPLVYVNEQFTEMTGYTAEEAIGRNCRFLQGEGTDEEPVEAVRTAIEAVEPVTVELRNYRRDGEPFWNRLSIAPVRDDDGDLTHFISFQEDVSARRDREAKLELENERLEDFASVISHDIRNPLQAARGQLDYAEQTGEESAFGKARGSLDRIDEIIDDVLTLSRRNQDIDRATPTDLGTIARRAWETVATGSLTLTVVADTRIQAAPSPLQELFENLFRNTLEHSDGASTVTVGAIQPLQTATRSATDDAYGFYVSDDGPGIPEQERRLVFDADFSTTTDGTGLGLAIVEQIATAHGWDVTVTDSVSGGARFEFAHRS